MLRDGISDAVDEGEGEGQVDTAGDGGAMGEIVFCEAGEEGTEGGGVEQAVEELGLYGHGCLLWALRNGQLSV